MREPNILFIVIDALRARNLGCYGYSNPTSPNMDSLAKEGLLFEKAYATTNSTDPCLTTIFSGYYPISHGIINHGESVGAEEIVEFTSSGIKLLPELLKSRGYTTLALDWLDRWHKRGYDYYAWEHRHAGAVTQKLPQFLQSLVYKLRAKSFQVLERKSAQNITNQGINLIRSNLGKNFLLFLHYWDVHVPNNPPRKYIKPSPNRGIEIKDILSSASTPQLKENLKNYTRGAKTASQVVDRYDGAISFVDHEIGRIIDVLKEHQILDKTLIILTSDHGGCFTEHGIYFEHTSGLYDENTHVPLILRYPEVIPENLKIGHFVQHVDIVPTILDILNMGVLDSFDGKSLMPLITGNIKEPRSEIYLEEATYQKKFAIRTRDYKYIYAKSKEDATCRVSGRIYGGIEELYDLNKDPGENNNIVDKEPEISQSLKERLLSWRENMEVKKLERRRLSQRIRELKKSGRV